jgi:hypothetical protein
MAEIVFSNEELEEVDRVCADLDPETHELTRPFLDSLESLGLADEREWVLGYFRRALRSELIMGLLLRAATDAAVSQGAADPMAASAAVNEDFDERYSYKRSRPEINYTIRKSTWQHDFSCLGRRGTFIRSF